jgi:hypothetical protein
MNIDWNPILISNISNIFYFRNVSMHWFEIIKYNIFEFHIKYVNIDKINYLKNKYTNIQLHCYFPENITDILILENIIYIKNIHTLYIYNCQNITNISMLGDLNTLDIYNCHNITNLFGLENLQVLDISNNQNITDISMLGNLFKLDIRYCYNITKFPKPNKIVHYFT